MIRVALADDHAILRGALARALAEQGDLKVVAQVGSAAEVLPALKDTPVDVLVLDVSMPGPGVLEVLGHVKGLTTVRTVVLTMHAEDQYAVRLLRAGAAGYLTKDCSIDDLAEAVRTVHAGGVHMSPSVAARLTAPAGSAGQPVHERLSRREFEVLSSLAAGWSIKEVGARLGIHPKTVSTYRARLLLKLEIKTNADLVRYAVERKLAGPRDVL